MDTRQLRLEDDRPIALHTCGMDSHVQGVKTSSRNQSRPEALATAGLCHAMSSGRRSNAQLRVTTRELIEHRSLSQ